ncbi:hypothetical protein OIU77_014813 [Salix suchowensis]|uniref:Uncharacterized protein n=1 Tax=Salix suchowensis TaxID=1278906 RepID=A0ABQ8ZYJ8_9ROSI|nr:hypothetical protein OIU77_014813 [Salix suchowensis]
MSTQQPLQQPPPAQPVVLYPNTVSRQAPSSHSNGSFGNRFYSSGSDCCYIRICNKRLNKQKVSNDKPSSLRLSQHTPSFGPRERGRDLEIGFDRGFTAARHGNGSDPARGHKPFGKGHFSGQNARGEANTSAGDQGAPTAGP